MADNIPAPQLTDPPYWILTTQAVEAAARALFEHDKATDDPPWETLTDDDRESYHHAARSTLAAAAPHLIAAERRQVVRTGVAVAIYRDEQVLMIRRDGSHGAGTWSLPGGWVEYGEDPANAARREMLEEVGVTIKGLRYETWTSDVFPADGKHCLTLWYSAEIDSGEPTSREPDKVTDVRWVDRRGPYPQPLFLRPDRYTAILLGRPHNPTPPVTTN